MATLCIFGQNGDAQRRQGYEYLKKGEFDFADGVSPVHFARLTVDKNLVHLVLVSVRGHPDRKRDVFEKCIRIRRVGGRDKLPCSANVFADQRIDVELHAIFRVFESLLDVDLVGFGLIADEIFVSVGLESIQIPGFQPIEELVRQRRAARDHHIIETGCDATGDLFPFYVDFCVT